MKSSYSHIPLSTIIFAQPGDSSGKVPELLFSRFYNCSREAKISTSSAFLQLNVTSLGRNKQKDRVSIPVPIESIEAISVLSGMNPFEEMLRGLSEKNALESSIERWSKEIEERSAAHAAKLEELQSLPEVEDEPVEESAEIKEDNENADNAMDTEAVGYEGDTNVEGADGAEVENEKTEEEIQAEQEQREEAERVKREETEELERARKERAEMREKRNRMVELVEKLATSLSEAEQGIAEDQEKLAKINEEFGEQLRMFEDGTEGAEETFLDELNQEVSDAIPQQQELDEGTSEDVAMETNEYVGGAVGEQTNNQVNGFDEKQETEFKKPEDLPRFNEMPVRIIVTLKKPLEKFYASNTKNPVCDKEVIEKTTMVVLECSSSQNAEFCLKLLNEVFEGPWKDMFKKPAEVLSPPYSLDKTIRYLLKLHKRQEVVDNTLVSCQLCETLLRRVVMEKHTKDFCQMREEPCRYCKEVFVMNVMGEHQNKDCPKFPVPCPQRCFGGKYKRCEVEEHLKTCMNSVVDCRFSALGCKATLKRKQLRRHTFDDAHKHLELLESRVRLVTDFLVAKDPSLSELLNPPEPPSKQEEEVGQEDEGVQLPPVGEGAGEAMDD